VHSRGTHSRQGGPSGHLGGLVLRRAREHGQRPFVTFVNGGSGERTELGCATFENWTAKAANLLVEELDLEPGTLLATALGTHWTALVLQVAAWRVGLVVGLPGSDGTPAAGAFREGEPAPAEPAVVVGTGMAARLVGDPGTALPFAEEVLAFPDEFADHPGEDAEVVLAAADGVRTSADLLAEAAALAERAGLAPGDRWVSTVPTDTVGGVVAGPVLALHLGGGLVLATGEVDLPRLAEQERAVAVLVPAGGDAPPGAIEVNP
jgi:uncharacterized protein (TIGR03089 family)